MRYFFVFSGSPIDDLHAVVKTEGRKRLAGVWSLNGMKLKMIEYIDGNWAYVLCVPN